MNLPHSGGPPAGQRSRTFRPANHTRDAQGGDWSSPEGQDRGERPSAPVRLSRLRDGGCRTGPDAERSAPVTPTGAAGAGARGWSRRRSAGPRRRRPPDRSGRSAQISSTVMPRIVGAPPIRLGSTVIRSNVTPRSYGGQVGNPSVKPRAEYVPKFGPPKPGGRSAQITGGVDRHRASP